MNKLTTVIVFNIMVVLSVMYATQPLQPLLAQEFNISIVHSSYFTAVILFWLAVAPIIYGYILEGISAKKMLLTASVILLFTNIALGFADSFELFLAIRFIEGVTVPAILTSSMTILAHIDPTKVKFNMSLYVASTVLGGLLGRVISGAIATHFGWQWVFFSLSFALFIGAIMVFKEEFNYEANLTRAKVKDVVEILKEKRFLLMYLMMFFVFFVFAGLLNLLPFRMKDLFSDVSEAKIGILYLGYGSGIVVSLMSGKISKFFKGEINAILVGGVFYTLIIAFFVIQDLWTVFALMFLLCLGMFTVHSVASGIVNSLYQNKKGLTSGLYLTFYYIGGALGSIIPTYLYQSFGWESVIGLFLVMLVVIFLTIYKFRKIY